MHGNERTVLKVAAEIGTIVISRQIGARQLDRRHVDVNAVARRSFTGDRFSSQQVKSK